MKLPTPGVKYEPGREAERNRQIEASDRFNHKRGQDVEINPGRLILTSPDGTRWAVVVDDMGALSAEAI